VEEAAVSATPIWGRTHQLMAQSDLLLTKSGTSTLEASVFGTPMVAIYLMSRVSYHLMEWMLAIPHYALPNIVVGRRVVPEAYQMFATSEHIADSALRLLDGENLAAARADLAEVKAKLGEPGASKRAAEAILRSIRE
jgi:lipid-A-disaccharide synthase